MRRFLRQKAFIGHLGAEEAGTRPRTCRSFRLKPVNLLVSSACPVV